MSLDDADDGIALRQMLNQGYADSGPVSVESCPVGHDHFTGHAGRNLTQQQWLGVVGHKFEEVVFEGCPGENKRGCALSEAVSADFVVLYP